MDNPAAVRPGPEVGEPGRPTAVGTAIITAVGRQMTNVTGIYMLATAMALPVGIVSTIITVHYLPPAAFGELGLLFVLASFITVVYNIGLLHGTFLWVYGTSGEGGDDLDIGTGQTDVASQRRAMSTGLLLALIIAVLGTFVFFTFAKPLAALLLGAPHAANLIGLAAISGGAGSLFRMTTNVFRFERRPIAFAVATVARPITVLIVSSALIIAGYGVWGALLGTALPTLACVVVNILVSWRNYALVVSWRDARAIATRTAWVVVPLMALTITHNGDLFLLSHFVHGSSLGVYRLASRLASPPSYFASAVMMAWSPMERSPIFLAAFQVRGTEAVRSLMLTYYIIAALTIVVIFSLFSHVFLLVAPAGYAGAADIVPLASLAFVMYGLYIVVLRTARPAPLIPWYTATAVLSAVVFVGSGFLLVPAFGVYGPPAAVVVGMASGSVALVLVNRRTEIPLPVQYRRIVAATLVSAAVSALGIAAAGSGRVTATIAAVVGLIVYFPALVLTGAIPASHLPILRSMLPRRRDRNVRISIAMLPAAERDALQRFRDGDLEGWRAVDYARFTRALRRLRGSGTVSLDDARVGAYLASRDPESIRQFQLQALIDEGIEAFEVSNLERLARDVRRGRLDTEREARQPRSALRARVRALKAGDRAELRDALSAASATDGSAAHGRPGELALVRALRVIRRSLGIGAASEADSGLARALWCDDGRDLAPHHRAELRRLKAAVRLATHPGDDGPDSPDSPRPDARPRDTAKPLA